MSGTVIDTERLRLLVRKPAEVLSWIDSLSASDKAEVSADWLARVRAATVADVWTCGFVVLHRGSGAAIGSCAYKSAPDPDGFVEIAYGVDPKHQGLGYATEAAQALTKYAFGTGLVNIVRAHTLRVPNASTRVLAKCGFEFVGDVIEPDDGPVWRWERRR
ncbi:MAG: GNAT family N-acetyltransferase [Gemmatimonadaceae bacterium]